jgi:hypothetical protein
MPAPIAGFPLAINPMHGMQTKKQLPAVQGVDSVRAQTIQNIG